MKSEANAERWNEPTSVATSIRPLGPFINPYLWYLLLHLFSYWIDDGPMLGGYASSDWQLWLAAASNPACNFCWLLGVIIGQYRNFFRPAVDMPSNLAQKLGQRARVGCIFKPILQLSLDFLADYIVSWPHYGPQLRNDTIKTERAIHGNIC